MAKKKTNNKTMKRRNFLKGAGAAALGAAAVSSFPAPAISGGHMEWIACSAFGKASGLGKAIDRFAIAFLEWVKKTARVIAREVIQKNIFLRFILDFFKKKKNENGKIEVSQVPA